MMRKNRWLVLLAGIMTISLAGFPVSAEDEALTDGTLMIQETEDVWTDGFAETEEPAAEEMTEELFAGIPEEEADALPEETEEPAELEEVGSSYVPATSIWRLVSEKSGEAFIRWKPITGAGGYQIQYSVQANMSGSLLAEINGNTKNTQTIKNLAVDRNWYFRVRTYVWEYGSKTYSAWSGIKSVYVPRKPANTVVYSMTSPSATSFQMRWRGVAGIDGYQLRFGTDSTMRNAKTASVTKKSAKGTVITSYTRRDAAPGTVYYAQARTFTVRNGVRVYSDWCGVKSVRTMTASVSGRWIGDMFMKADGTFLKGGVYNIGGKNYFFNAAGNNIRMGNSMQIITASRTPKVNNAYYIKSNGEAAVNEWCDVSTCWGQDGYWQPYFRSLRRAYFNANGMLELGMVPGDIFNWTTVEVTNDSTKSDGVRVVREGYWTLTPNPGKTAYYQWICKNCTTNLEECRTVFSTTTPVKNIAFGMGYDYNPWCLRYMNGTIVRQNNKE